jgi:tetratricopeptide (TPR) repeat protein
MATPMSKSKRPKTRRDTSVSKKRSEKDVIVQIVEMDVIFDPIPDPDIEALPEEWRSRLAPLFEGFGKDFKRLIRLLEEATAYAPHIPLLWNFLTVAYMQSQNYDEAERLTLQTHERFPRYLTGTINYCQWLLKEGRADEVQAKLGGDFNLPRIAGRSSFHITEIVNFYVLLSDYHCKRGEFDVADRTLDCLEELVEDSPNVAAARQRVLYASLRQKLAQLVPSGTRRTTPRKKVIRSDRDAKSIGPIP